MEPTKYQGTLNGKPIVLREPTLNDLSNIELLLSEEAAKTKSLFMYATVVTLVEAYGDDKDKNSLTMSELKSLPMRCLPEVKEAFEFFRDDFELGDS